MDWFPDAGKFFAPKLIDVEMDLKLILMQQALKNTAEPVKQCPVRVYGLQGHSSYLAIDLPDEMLQEGEVFGYQEKFYQVCSVLKDSEDHFCLNVNSIVETL